MSSTISKRTIRKEQEQSTINTLSRILQEKQSNKSYNATNTLLSKFNNLAAVFKEAEKEKYSAQLNKELSYIKKSHLNHYNSKLTNHLIGIKKSLINPSPPAAKKAHNPYLINNQSINAAIEKYLLLGYPLRQLTNNQRSNLYMKIKKALNVSSTTSLINAIRKRYNIAPKNRKGNPPAFNAFMKTLIQQNITFKIKAENRGLTNPTFVPGTSLRTKGYTEKNYGREFRNLITKNFVQNVEQLEKRIYIYSTIRNIFIEYVLKEDLWVKINNMNTQLQPINVENIITNCVKLFGHIYVQTPTLQTSISSGGNNNNNRPKILNNRNTSGAVIMKNDLLQEANIVKFITFMNELLENSPQPKRESINYFTRVKNFGFNETIKSLQLLSTLSPNFENIKTIKNGLEDFAKSQNNLYYKITSLAKSSMPITNTLLINASGNNNVMNRNILKTYIDDINSLTSSYHQTNKTNKKIIPMRLNISKLGVYDHEPPTVKIFSDFLNYIIENKPHITQFEKNYAVFDKNCRFYQELYKTLEQYNSTNLCTCVYTPLLCRSSLDKCLPRTVVKYVNEYSSTSSVYIKQTLEAYAAILHGIFSHYKVGVINEKVGVSKMGPANFELYVQNSINEPFLNSLRRKHTISVIKITKNTNEQINLENYFFTSVFPKNSITNKSTNLRRDCFDKLTGGACTRTSNNSP